MDSTVENPSTIRVAAVVICDAQRRILTVRKRGTQRFMLPGGKPEAGEEPQQTAAREAYEEIGLDLGPHTLEHLGQFIADAANEPGQLVQAEAYLLPGAQRPEDLQATAEIEELRWMPAEEIVAGLDVAPLLSTQIIPAWVERGG